MTEEQKKQVVEWNKTFDEVDFLGELTKTPTLAAIFGGRSKAQTVSVGNSLSGNYKNCTINFIVKKDDADADKENSCPKI